MKKKFIIIVIIILIFVNTLIGCINIELSEKEKFYGHWEFRNGESYFGDLIIFYSNDSVWYNNNNSYDFEIINNTIRLDEIGENDSLFVIVRFYLYDFSVNDKILTFRSKFLGDDEKNGPESSYVKIK